jgi:hypothetical protein
MDEEIKSGEWILDYVNMLIGEVKNYPKQQRETTQFHQAMATKHQTFFAKFPHLMTKICDDAEEFDVSHLKEMLGTLKEIREGKRDVDQVNQEMGQKYFDKYVSPHINWNKEKKSK